MQSKIKYLYVKKLFFEKIIKTEYPISNPNYTEILNMYNVS